MPSKLWYMEAFAELTESERMDIFIQAVEAGGTMMRVTPEDLAQVVQYLAGRTGDTTP